MRICFFAEAKSIHTVRWCNHFQQMGHEIHLISFQENDIPNTKVHIIDSGKIKVEGGNWRVLLKFPKIKKNLKEIKPDVFHAHYATSYGISGALCSFHPYVVTCLGTDVLVSPKESKIINFLLRFAFKRTDLITVLADHMVPSVLDLNVRKDKVAVIPFGIDTAVVVDHECEIGQFCHLSIGSIIGSGAKVSARTKTEMGQIIAPFSTF